MSTNEIILLIDTSQSILRPGALSALQEVIEKIYNDLIFNPIEVFFNSISVYQCGNNEVTLKTEQRWLPCEKDCKGVAPIISALCNDIEPLLKKKKKQNTVIIIISDGYWCGDHSKWTKFEFDCFHEELAILVELNIIDLDMWNSTLPQTIKLFSTDDAVTKKVLAATKQKK